MKYIIDFPKSVYLKNFYGYIIPKLRIFFSEGIYERLIFNFNDVDFISPNIIPNLLNIADIYKKYFNNNIELKLSWNTSLLSYLDSLDFFKYVNEYNLFSYNYDMIGGFETYETKENCKLICLSKNASKNKIIEEVNNLIKAMNVVVKKNERFEEYAELFYQTLFHLIHNSTNEERGNSNAYSIFQINTYRDGSSYAYITVTDNGVGIEKSITNKVFYKNEKSAFVKPKSDSFDYILEALFWRKLKPETHGLYQIAELVLNYDGKIGLHSDSLYCNFTKQNFYNEFKEISRQIENKKEVKVENKKEIKNRVSITKKYQGVHIDIEIPLG